MPATKKKTEKTQAKVALDKVPTSYRQLMSITNLPLADRPELPMGRDQEERVPRRFHVVAAKLTKLKEEYKQTKRIPNPHNQGAYRAFGEALINLGVDKVHAHVDVKNEMQRLMGAADTRDGRGETLWDRFRNKKPRNRDTGKDVNGRIRQNAETEQRLTGPSPYGFKWLQIGREILGTKGIVIDIMDMGDGRVGYRMNTNSNTPVNQFRRAFRKPKDKPVAQKPAKVAKPAKPAKKADKPAKKRAAKVQKPAVTQTPAAPVVQEQPQEAVAVVTA